MPSHMFQVALNALKRALSMSPRTQPWGIAGTKDKRGVTTQVGEANHVSKVVRRQVGHIHAGGE
jgi:tRNA(Glu) U13 pseudouridine synthase TruD